MKIITIILISSIFLTSCSLTLGGIVALDNATNAGEKVIENYEDLKPNQKIKIEFLNKTNLSGLFKAITKVSGENQIIIVDEKAITDTFRISDISRIYSINEGGNVYAAVAIGAVIDVVILIIINNGINLGFTPFN